MCWSTNNIQPTDLTSTTHMDTLSRSRYNASICFRVHGFAFWRNIYKYIFWFSSFVDIHDIQWDLKASTRSYQSSRRFSTYKNRELLYVSRGTPARVGLALHIHTLAKSIATWGYGYSQYKSRPYTLPLHSPIYHNVVLKHVKYDIRNLIILHSYQYIKGYFSWKSCKS